MTHALRNLPEHSDALDGVLRIGICAYGCVIDAVVASSPMQSQTLRMQTGVSAAH